LVAEDSDDEFAVDGAELASCTELQGIGRDAVDIPEAPVGFLMDQGNGVGREEVAVGAGMFEAVSDVLGSIAGGGLAE
jgi:hypothetical protein